MVIRPVRFVPFRILRFVIIPRLASRLEVEVEVVWIIFRVWKFGFSCVGFGRVSCLRRFIIVAECWPSGVEG